MKLFLEEISSEDGVVFNLTPMGYAGLVFLLLVALAIMSFFVNTYPGKGRSASMGISIGNNLEAKVRDKADTTGVGTKKVKLIDQLTFNTGINLLADSLKRSSVFPPAHASELWQVPL